MASSLSLSASVRGPHRLPDLALACAALVVVLALQAGNGFPTLLSAAGDNDSLMRLAEIRDWLGGQGWFDLHQYRMGPDGGFVMHWSRLVDAPVAALMLVGAALGGSMAAGETFAQFAWPGLLFVGALMLVLRIARRLGGEGASLPALVIGAGALDLAGTFAPGLLDHHNAQLLLTLAMLAALMEARERPPAGWLAGLAAALMLGIGMETMPYVAAAGLFAALDFAWGGEEAASSARRFGLGLAGGAALVFAATVAPGEWGVAACDAFSAPQFALAGIGGLGLAAATLLTRAGLALRLGALALVGAAAGGALVAFFPQCVAEPYAGLDPRLHAFWLGAIAEAQPFSKLLRTAPADAAGRYGPPFLAALVLALRLGRRPRREDVLFAFVFGAALLVSIWQARGAYFSMPLAAPALAAWVAGRRDAAARGASPGVGAAVVAAWMLSLNLVWAAAVALVIPAKGPEEGKQPAAPAAVADAACRSAASYGALAALPPARLLAAADLGSQILAFTPQRPLTGLYHRNAAGGLKALEIWSAAPGEAAVLARGAQVGLVALCPGNGEAKLVAALYPDGLGALLLAGRVPDWLVPIAGAEGASLRLFRVSPP